MSPGFRVLAITYNIAQTQGKGARSIKSWLPVDEKSPDFVAIGLQETAPLWLSLLGLTQSTLTAYEKAVKAALEETGVTYRTLVKKAIGGNALILLVREGSPASAVIDVHTSSASFGIVFMANKGAVGARVMLVGEKSDDPPSLTFVTGHLAAHEHKLQRRNADWKEIVGRVVFSGGRQIYDTSCLFVLGDLNYRIDPGAAAKRKGMSAIVHKIHNDLDSLRGNDQLTREILAGRTMHHLHEGQIAFQPTYKMLKGQVEGYKTKRIPSWCDRILYTTFDNRHTRLRKYVSHPKAIASDHKPVSALFSLPPIEGRSLKLRHSAPFPRDSLALPKAIVGRVLDTVVGLLWLVTATLGFGNDKLGLANVVVLLTAAAYFRTR